MGRIYTARRIPSTGAADSYAGVLGLVRYHDSVLSTITTVTGVSVWGDLTRAANHFIQATTTKQPILTANAINTTMPALLFDGVDDTMQATSNTTTPRTRISVLKWITAAAGTMVDGAGNHGRIFRGGAALTSYHSGSTQVDDAASTPSAWHVYSFVLANGQSLCRVDGVQKGTFAASFTGADKAAIGTFGDLASDPCNGYIAADLEWNRVLSTTELQAAELALKTRWGTP